MGLFYVIFTFFFTSILGMPIAFSLGLTGLVTVLILGNVPLTVIPRMMWVSISSFPLLAVSLYMFAGELMNESGITNKLLKLADVLVGHIVGGLAHANILASMFFAGITGAAASDVAALGPIEMQMMTEQGYDRPFSAAVTVASALIGPIIPPSLPMILLGVTANISIGALFIAGYIPGILMGIGLMVVAYLQSKKRNYYHREKRASLNEILEATKETVIPLILPVIIMGGILSGIFTATEAAAVACIYGLMVSLFVLKTILYYFHDVFTHCRSFL